MQMEEATTMDKIQVKANSDVEKILDKLKPRTKTFFINEAIKYFYKNADESKLFFPEDVKENNFECKITSDIKKMKIKD